METRDRRMSAKVRQAQSPRERNAPGCFSEARAEFEQPKMRPPTRTYTEPIVLTAYISGTNMMWALGVPAPMSHGVPRPGFSERPVVFAVAKGM